MATPHLALDRTNHRRLGAQEGGDVFVWDIDKTYLDTHFSSWRGLVGIGLEAAVDKRAVPGTVPLLRALRRGPGRESALVPLYFVSGSPKQLRSVLERKMLLDGVDFDGITLKDWGALIRRGRLGAVRAQIGYKLTALLLYAGEVSRGASFWLFGDDVEADAVIFSLFSRILGGLRGASLGARLAELAVDPRERDAVVSLAAGLDGREAPRVAGIFIHLARGKDPAALSEQVGAPDAAATPVIATRSFLQTALVLAARGRVRAEVVGSVAEELRRAGIPEATLAAELEDARLRLGVSDALVAWARS